MEEDNEVKEILREEFFRDWIENASQQQIIEKLIQNDERAKQIKELEELLEEKTLRIGFENKDNYIPKSKVKEKIEELRNEEYGDITFKYNKIEVNGIIEVVLQELLEES